SRGIPNFYTPENAVEAFSFFCAHRRNQALLMQAPAAARDPDATPPDLAAARSIRERALAERRALLTGPESRALLAAFRLPVPKSVVAETREQALAAAREIGFPVALKLHSPDITHKSDVGGVRLNLQNAEMVASAFEDMIGHVRKLRPEARIAGALLQPMLRFAHAREVQQRACDPGFGPQLADVADH